MFLISLNVSKTMIGSFITIKKYMWLGIFSFKNVRIAVLRIPNCINCDKVKELLNYSHLFIFSSMSCYTRYSEGKYTVTYKKINILQIYFYRLKENIHVGNFMKAVEAFILSSR